MKPLIGVIVPVYKVEKYIAECIESILSQTYTDFRLILIDDGTPDTAGKICDEYAKKDPRITVIHQENAGVTRARARGVKEASNCEWITFVDSDDTITPNALETMLEEILTNDSDIVVSHFSPFTNIKKEFITIEEYRYYLLTELHISPGPVSKLFKKELFDDSVFNMPRNLIIAEDVIMNIRLSFKTNKKVRYIQEETYIYRLHQNSTYHSHKRTPENEQLIQESRIESIPKEEIDKYIKATIYIRLLRSREFWGYKYVVKGMKETEFYKVLQSDIKHYKYIMPTLDKIIFNHTNPIVRFIAINLKKLSNVLKP